MSFRIARKISSYFVKVKLYSLERTVGSEKCRKSRWEVYLNIKETDRFTSTTTGNSFKKNYKLKYDDNCMTYILTCKYCGKQYLGGNNDEFCLRLNNYNSNDTKNVWNKAYMQEHLVEHFKSQDHNGFLGNIFIAPIDKADCKDSKKRKLLDEDTQNLCSIST